MKCYLCGKNFPKGSLTRDHVIPRVLWDNYSLFDYYYMRKHNVQYCCKKCNEEKDSKVLLVPLSSVSWWPQYQNTSRQELIPPTQYLVRKLLKTNIPKESKKIIREWLDCSNKLEYEVHEFDKHPVFIPIVEETIKS